jgi:DNA-directed RNA polymerase beta' subunit
MANSVAFSGRAVIAPGGDLRIDQCGLPDELAWHLFGPIAARHAGIEAVRSRTPEAAKELDRVMADSWVILCREPAVIPTALLAFHPLRIPEPVIRLHPQCCAPMNADFDGDQVTVYLPITPAGQREAAELLSVAAHLRRDPTLSKWLVPAHESLWGLAELSRSSEGRAQLTALAGFDLTGGNGFVTRASLQQALTQLLQNHGPQRALDMLESLARLGFDVARKTGASLNPFARRTMPRPPAPPTGETTYQTAMAIQDDLADVLIAGTDYDALDIGPQLLAVKSGARGAPHHLVWGLICRTVKDCDARLHYFPESLLGGLSADAAFLSCIGARIGLADAVLHPIPSMRQAYHAAAPRGPEGFHVLARAMRSPNPGPVFARAALTGEIDPLTDINSRLFVGLPPRHP